MEELNSRAKRGADTTLAKQRKQAGTAATLSPRRRATPYDGATAWLRLRFAMTDDRAERLNS